MIEAVKKLLDENGIDFGGRRLLLAVSGGVDSMAMLHFIWKNNDVFCASNIVVCHLNHGLRGEESDLDEELVRDYCNRLSVPFVVGHANMNGQKRPPGHGLESWARELRYSFLRSQIESEADLILTAHNKNDHVETVLFRLARGTGLRGMAGIPVIKNGVVRPFLCLLRQDIEAYVENNDIPFRTDESNNSDDYARNRIRHYALPALQTVNDATLEHITRFSELALDADKYFERKADRLISENLKANGGYHVKAMRATDGLIQKYAARKLLEQHGISADGEKIASLLSVVNGGEDAVQLSGKYISKCVDELLFFTEKTEWKRIEYSMPLQAGKMVLPGGDAVFIEIYDIINGIEIKKDKTQYQNSLDYDKIDGGLVFRSGKPGDVFTSLRRGNSKALKKLFNENEIPPEERGCYPLLADRGGVVWLKGEGVSRRVAVDETTRRAISIFAVPEDREECATIY